MTKVLLLDVEGTVCPISFVKETLFPFARARFGAWLAAHPDDALVERIAQAAEVPASDLAAVGAALERWTDEDRKVGPLKELQGRLWREGYQRGAVVAPLYPDVAPTLRGWREAGARLAIFSSGSVEAQRLLFTHSSEGDLTPLLEAYFDTTTGPKREAASYSRIVEALQVAAPEVLFCSDVQEELDAAHAAGVETCLITRPGSVLPRPRDVDR